MANARPGATVRLESGPWRSVRSTPNPFDDLGADELGAASNCYPADAARGGGFFQRPGATQPTSVAGLAIRGGHMHVATDGTVYNFVFILNGSSVLKVYRWDAMGASLTDVTPTNLVISATTPLYATSLNGEMIVSDGINKMWRATNLGSTPITATALEVQTPSVALSRGSTDTALANTAFSYTVLSGASIGQQFTRAADALGLAIGALGTLPADKWVSILVELATASGTMTFTAAAGIAAGYASEAAAIAALPARTATSWYVGYVTVRAQAGFAWIAGTDAFAGGTTGNEAQTTNYYAGEGPAYSVFGQPVIYTGALFVIYQQVAAAYARTTIGWSEPNQPSVGFQQTGYDNQWTLTQTGTSPLYVLAPTNDALYYSRELSWGALGGAPGVNFRGTATHDIVSGNVGCTSPRTPVIFLNALYFADQNGRPYRFVFGGAPEPLWKQAASVFDAATVTTDATLAPWALIEPNLNLYLVNFRDHLDVNTLLAFDAITGRYAGTWTIGNDTMVFGTTFRDAATTASGNVSAAFFGLPSNVTAWKLALVSDGVWADNGTPMQFVSITSGKMGYADALRYTVDKVRAILGYATGATPTIGLSLTTSQAAATSFGNGYYVAAPPELPLYRLSWSAPAGAQGRSVQLTLTASSPTRQVRFYKMAADAVTAELTPEDW